MLTIAVRTGGRRRPLTIGCSTRKHRPDWKTAGLHHFRGNRTQQSRSGKGKAASKAVARCNIVHPAQV
jgi:hypothetical protein